MTDTARADEAPLPRSAGERLRAAREAQGLSLAAVGERTRIPLRHLEAIESGDYAGLPSPTYAVGFARAYARAVGENDVAIAAAVRAESAGLARPKPEYQPYVAADPARLPSRGLAIVAAGVALGVLILAALFLGPGLFHRSGETPAPTPTPAAVVTTPVPARTAPSGGQVTLTATDEVWVRVYDASNNALLSHTMKAGERFDVPPTASRPMIAVGRPDKLQVTLNGSAVPPLGDGKRPIKDVPVDAASIAARLGGAPIPPAPPSPTPSPTAAAPAPIASSRSSPRPSASSHRSTGGDEVARANRQAERAAERRQPLPAPTATTSAPTATPTP